MASLLLRRSLLLPPAIRTSIYQSSLPHLRRHASTATTHEIPTAASEVAAAAPAINPFAESLMTIPSLLLDTLHATGLPWYAVLPLTALIVRGGLVYNFSTLPARRRAVLRRNLSPIVGAHMRRTLIQRRIKKQPAFRPLLYFQTMIAMSRDFKIPLFNVRSLLNFGVLIAMTETVRVKCGGREGVLSLITKPLTWLFSKKYPTVAAGSEPMKMASSPDEILAERLFDAREAKAQAAGLSSSDIPIEAVHLEKLNTNPYAAYIEPSMRTEGLSFIPDLTLPDPTFTLPCLLTLTMAAGILLRRQPPLTTPEVPTPDAKKQPLTNGQRLGLSVSLLFGLGATQFPAAVLLYLVPNMTIAWLQGRWLDVKYPIPGTVEPCRKPVRLKVRKDFEMPTQV
ncbi:unnamed protein product [Zymoseptoria tritici ST99CH_1A5]|uniref:Uncharacterized protein n=4 Tax=Zymoseptoria tritici TaxID=1047171 RepID=F9XNK6_ZYMTI|nr:uncharacterized protein MYCGRDRAFT_111450 [Zymoseptoria tritici IPO323]EGP83150.1 hypothetical protein MYCGRDRAFT_111450 [Zymoseptoria tritici IPO323]SMQ55681.1 unnamed protein product [Zymoseptoria tritici ST99CH_3D7]SMR60869.1 unnamed protein product [Zymoseptoria tritici ST99CH_1E4]SMY29362.1 unnamed protein product [Zymoseptoria tritici ST99CH_1A5]